MLQDMHLLSVYFDPAQAGMYEDDLTRRYGAAAVQAAIAKGWVVSRWMAGCGYCRRVLWISNAGHDEVARLSHSIAAE